MNSDIEIFVTTAPHYILPMVLQYLSNDVGFYFLLHEVVFSVPMSIRRYTSIESAETISASILSEIFMAISVLPQAVGPVSIKLEET